MQLPIFEVDVISGTPAAFSGTCSEQHLPGFFSKLGELRQRGIQNIYVIAVNDPFVMNAWKDSFNVDSAVRFSRVRLMY
jgi:glutaredoxin/glutathione-dependent peroxiredoxin